MTKIFNSICLCWLFLNILIIHQVATQTFKSLRLYSGRRLERGIMNPQVLALSSTAQMKANCSINISINTSTKPAKWPSDGVSKRQYDSENMFWQKSKLFVVFDSTTAKFRTVSSVSKPASKIIRNEDSVTRLSPRNVENKDRKPSVSLFLPKIDAITPSSYIEFYYWDDENHKNNKETKNKANNFLNRAKQVTVDRIFFNDSNKKVNTTKNINYLIVANEKTRSRNNKNKRNSHQFVTKSFTTGKKHNIKIIGVEKRNVLTGATMSTDSTKSKSLYFNIWQPYFHFKSVARAQPYKYSYEAKLKPIGRNEIKIHEKEITHNHMNKNVCKPASTAIKSLETVKYFKSMCSKNGFVKRFSRPTTIYDKIKFFEIYDAQTQTAKTNNIPHIAHNDTFMDEDTTLVCSSKITLENVEIQDNKKNISRKNKRAQEFNSDDKCNKRHDIIENLHKSNSSHEEFLREYTSVTKAYEFSSHSSKSASWSEFPFAAVYIHEPSQVHCDAAAISDHWVVTAGSCLFRHHKELYLEGRSAFVTYCGVDWKEPERIAYVKYSVVHPRFHPRDQLRRHLYNIGLAQVVNAMFLTCPGMSAISLTSYMVDPAGTKASAVGWGVDRYATNYASTELPKTQLKQYEGIIYADKCPGNTEYSKLLQLPEKGGAKNVYCLSLPPYRGENEDPIHGGLLIIGGKLIALYLEEERRSWGEQCAQYTGVWRLTPWITSTAREPENLEQFSVEI